MHTTFYSVFNPYSISSSKAIKEPGLTKCETIQIRKPMFFLYSNNVLTTNLEASNQ